MNTDEMEGPDTIMMRCLFLDSQGIRSCFYEFATYFIASHVLTPIFP